MPQGWAEARDATGATYYLKGKTKQMGKPTVEDDTAPSSSTSGRR